MSIESELQALEVKIQQGTTEYNRAQGVLESAMTRLKTEHNCTTIAEAEALQGTYEMEAKEHEAQAQKHLDECKRLIEGASVA